ncbi:TolC family protein [Olivibacter sp. SDN3]|uniref:TolC family protein n=1 Tax=Olivibacter sp. SDN3 TaxID=2764720 RepID=UPI0016515C7F|nr:TolC family protein [Olivibacter sp. SDN3]QNL50985.1 TolC family protein [Olivibacter sp. SDN3]
MNARKHIILIFIYIFPLLAFGQDTLQHHFNLEDCIELALKNNANAQISSANSELAHVDLKEAKARLLPTLNGQLSHEINTGRNTNPVTNENIVSSFTAGQQSLNTSVVLFNGLNQLRTIRQQAFRHKAFQAEEQRVKDDLTMDVILAYLQVITAQDVLEQSKQQREVTARQVERLSILMKDGATSPGDYYDIKGQLSGEEVAVLTAENTLRTNIIALTALLNIPYSDQLTFEPIKQIPGTDADSLDEQTLYQRAAESLGILKAMEFSKRSADYGLRASRSRYFPTLSLGANLASRYYSETTNGNNHDPYFTQIQDNLGRGVGLTLSIPILNGFARKQDVSRAKIAVRTSTIDLENAQNNLQQQTSQVLIDLRTAKEKYLKTKAQVDAYNELFRVTQVRFEAGAINSVEFLQQKNKYDQANIGLVVAQYEWQLRQRIANYYNGER